MPTKITICIVGLGRAGQFHLNSIKRLDNLHLKYVVDPGISPQDPIVLENDFELLSEIDVALQDSDLDAIIVSSPTSFHYEYITKALHAGKHVFTEKPLGKTVEEIKTCFTLAKEKQLALFLGFQRRYDLNFQELKRSIPKIGPIRIIKTSSRDNPKPSLDYLKISGNIFHDMLIHDFDMLLFLLGAELPTSVFALGHSYDPEIAAIPDFDTVLVTLQYENGLMVSIDTSRTAPYGYDQRIELFAEQGMAIAENQRNTTIQMHTEEGRFESPINFSFPQRYKDSYVAEIKDFAQGILTGELHNVSMKECLLGHLIADAAHLAATEGRVVDFNAEFGEGLTKSSNKEQ